MAAVLAQMGGDAVSASLNRKQGRAQRIWNRAAARIAQGCHMIDIDAETEIGRTRYPFTRSTWLTTGRARKCDMIVVKCFRSVTSISIVSSRKSAEMGRITILSILAP